MDGHNGDGTLTASVSMDSVHTGADDEVRGLFYGTRAALFMLAITGQSRNEKNQALASTCTFRVGVFLSSFTGRHLVEHGRTQYTDIE